MTASESPEGRNEDESQREGEALLAMILDSLAEAVLVADASSKIILCNRSADELLGADVRDTPAEHWIGLLSLRHPDGRPFDVSELPLSRALRGERVDDLELIVRPGSEAVDRYLSATARPLLDANGRLWGGVAVLRDVSVQRLHEAQLVVSDRMASVGALAAGVTHEINNPLAAVIANVELAISDGRQLGGSPVAERLIEELLDAKEAAHRVREIVRDLKLFSRSEEDRKGPVDVREVMESAIRMSWNEIRHRARLVRTFEEIPLVDANDARLGQVFLNLLINAAQAIPDGRAESNEIRIVLRLARDRVAVEIADTGSGMSDEVLRHVFTPFSTMKPVGMGSGLGLPICQRIVTGLGGDIRAESRLGVGSKFTVLLPVSDSSQAKKPPPRRTSSSPPPRRARVLVVDDEPSVALAVRRSLESYHDVVTVHRAEDALAILRAGENFDIVFCDVMMPNLTGVDFYCEVERIAPTELAKIVFLTGGVFARETRQFLDAISNQQLDKPFLPEELRFIVSERLTS